MLLAPIFYYTYNIIVMAPVVNYGHYNGQMQPAVIHVMRFTFSCKHTMNNIIVADTTNTLNGYITMVTAVNP